METAKVPIQQNAENWIRQNVLRKPEMLSFATVRTDDILAIE